MPKHAREITVFRVATGFALLHALDDAFLGRQPGVALGQHALAALVAVVASVWAIVMFPRLRPGLGGALAICLGAPALVNGGMHVIHIGFDRPDHSDLTGVLAALAGVTLIGVAAAMPWRHRGEVAGSTRRRWLRRGVAVVGGVVAAQMVLMPLVLSISEIHKPRERIGSPPDAGYQDVSFASTDGLRLSGWYRPSHNGATVIVVHGGGGDRSGAVRHAKLLVRHGYGVLLYDSRGRGRSQGEPNGWGWGWERDALGALDFVRDRPGVDQDRIGALGLSSGGDTVLDLAARRHELRAIVADGAALRTLEDAKRLGGGVTMMLPTTLMFAATRLISGQTPSRPLGDVVRDIRSPTLLVSGGRAAEYDFDVKYAKAAPRYLTHWNLPKAGHTAGLREFPVAYERHVIAFLDRALAARRLRVAP